MSGVVAQIERKCKVSTPFPIADNMDELRARERFHAVEHARTSRLFGCLRTGLTSPPGRDHENLEAVNQCLEKRALEMINRQLPARPAALRDGVDGRIARCCTAPDSLRGKSLSVRHACWRPCACFRRKSRVFAEPFEVKSNSTRRPGRCLWRNVAPQGMGDKGRRPCDDDRQASGAAHSAHLGARSGKRGRLW